MTCEHGFLRVLIEYNHVWVKFELTRITRLICLPLMYEKEKVGSSVDLAKFDTTREHGMIFASLG